MRRTAVLVASLCALATLAPTLPAAAYERVGFDPEGETEPSVPDIRSSLLRVEQRDNGRFLILVVRSYEDFNGGADVALDSRGGNAYERLMTMRKWNLARRKPRGCWVFTRSYSERLGEGVFRQRGKAVRCRVPIRFFKPTKSIRWRVWSYPRDVVSDPSAYWDQAPDPSVTGHHRMYA